MATEDSGVRYPEVQVQLIGEDGNAFALIGRCVKAARRGDVPREEIDLFKREAMSGDYDHLLQTCMEWWDVH